MLETEFSEVSYSVFLSSLYHPRRSIHSFFLPFLCLSVIHLNDPSPHSVSLSHLCIYYFSFSLFFCVPDFWLRRWKSCFFVCFFSKKYIFMSDDLFKQPLLSKVHLLLHFFYLTFNTFYLLLLNQVRLSQLGTSSESIKNS